MDGRDKPDHDNNSDGYSIEIEKSARLTSQHLLEQRDARLPDLIAEATRGRACQQHQQPSHPAPQATHSVGRHAHVDQAIGRRRLRGEPVLSNGTRRDHQQQTAAATPLLKGTGGDQTQLLIVATGERGLAGGFNSNIARLARDYTRKLQAEGKTVKILTIGRKGAEQLRRDFGKVMIDHVDLRGVRQLGYANALDIAQRITKRFDNGEFDVATLFFSQFVNIITQKPCAQQIIPVPVPEEPEAPLAPVAPVLPVLPVEPVAPVAPE